MEIHTFLENIKGDIWTKDPDDTTVARKFYENFWHDLLYNNIGTFRGESFISFNTLAGCMIRLLPVYERKEFQMPNNSKDRLDIIAGSELPCSVKKDFETFYDLYHCLANFLPLIKTETSYAKTKDNPYLQYVKNNYYHDFPDEFLMDVRRYYFGETNKHYFSQDLNLQYFKFFGYGENGWRNYVEKNFLQAFFTDNSFTKCKQITPVTPVPYSLDKFKALTPTQIEECKADIVRSLATAIEIIRERAKNLYDAQHKNYQSHLASSVAKPFATPCLGATIS